MTRIESYTNGTEAHNTDGGKRLLLHAQLEVAGGECLPS